MLVARASLANPPFGYHKFRPTPHPTNMKLVLPLLILSSFAFAQDASLLRPPKGAQVALVVFQDLQCPMCRTDAPLEEQAAKAHKIPLVRHDFPLPMHNWSFNAAVLARYFDSQGKDLGNQFRDFIFEHQPEITPDNLQSFAQRFATEHKTELPFVVDPQGKLAAEVNADKAFGNKVGIQHTPTLYVVSSRNPARPFVEVTDIKQLFQLIEAMQTE
jgi:protein-disulfide isomerase